MEEKQKCIECRELKNINEYSVHICTNKIFRTCKSCIEKINQEKKEIKIEQIDGHLYCKRCKKHYTIDNFSVNQKTKDYYKNCNKCKIENKNYSQNEENHKRKIQTGRIRYQKVKEQEKIYKKGYREKNREQILIKSKDYYQRNKERCAEYFQTNKDKIRQARYKFFQENPEKKVLRNVRSRISNVVRALIKDLKINMTPSEYKKTNNYEGFHELLGCNQEFFVEWISSQFDENMNWDNHGSYWHIDHTYPCSRIDINDEEQRKMCFCWKNLRPLEKSENISKSDKIIEEEIENQKKLAIEFEENFN